jgi:uncharacterized protein (DUF2164 family)
MEECEMAEIKFTREEKEALTRRIQQYFEKELDQEIGGFEAEFLLEFISKEIGAYYYNKGLQDAKTIFDVKYEEISESIYDAEKPIPFKK